MKVAHVGDLCRRHLNVSILSLTCSPTVNTDTETAVVNVRYAAKDQARL